MEEKRDAIEDLGHSESPSSMSTAPSWPCPTLPGLCQTDLPLETAIRLTSCFECAFHGSLRDHRSSDGLYATLSFR